jgi:2-polyprenyl-6-methoxyphenol hydroxylase-like FAD-dependent oxidoreductase
VSLIPKTLPCLSYLGHLSYFILTLLSHYLNSCSKNTFPQFALHLHLNNPPKLLYPIMSPPKIAIVGGGPAGLMLARLLTNASIPCTIFERDATPTSRTQGGTLDLHDDTGILAMKEANLYDQFLKYARFEGEDFVIADKTGRRYLNQQGTPDQPVGSGRPEIDRERLRAILFASVPEGIIKWGSTIRSVGEDGTLHLDSSTEGPFDLVIGAEGGFSRVRSLISETQAFYSGVGGVELTFSDADAKHPSISTHVGRGSFFTFSDSKGLLAQRLGDGSLKVSAYRQCTENWPKEFTSRHPHGGPEARKEVLSLYSDWAPEFQSWITDSDDLIVSRSLYMLPVGFTWEHRAGFTLIGDAAHLWTPFAGEGVNAAFVDSLELYRAILSHVKEGASTKLDDVVKDYETKMFGRTKPVAEETKQNLDLFFAETFPPENFEQMLAERMSGPPPE